MDAVVDDEVQLFELVIVGWYVVDEGREVAQLRKIDGVLSFDGLPVTRNVD